MITSERQLMSTQKRLSTLRQWLADPTRPTAESEALAKLSPDELQRLVQLLDQEVQEYLATKTMDVKDIAIHSPAELLLAPIRYRIATGMTVEEFARLVNVAQRQIARYEALGYQNCSMPTFQKIMERLNVRLEGRIAEAG